MRTPQGPCETTMTERFKNPDCTCYTYPGNLGPCAQFAIGENGQCVYCDHERKCHPQAWWSRLLCWMGNHDWRDGPGYPCTKCGKEDL